MYHSFYKIHGFLHNKIHVFKIKSEDLNFCSKSRVKETVAVFTRMGSIM